MSAEAPTPITPNHEPASTNGANVLGNIALGPLHTIAPEAQPFLRSARAEASKSATEPTVNKTFPMQPGRRSGDFAKAMDAPHTPHMQ